MRLEEWQKWLDSQFLDTADGQLAAEPSSEESQTAGPPDSAPSYLTAVETSPVLPEPVYDPGVRPYHAPAPAHTPPAAPPEPVYAAPPVETATPPPTPAPRPAPTFERAVPADDEGVPAIEQYLPFLRLRSAEPAPAATAQAETAAAPTPEPEPAARSGQPAVEALTAVEETETAEIVAEATPAETAPPVDPVVEEEPPVPARRMGPSSHRSKRSRHLPAEQAPAPMAAEEVWQLVPRHLRSLIAMSGDEVAQNSYKRNFKESRIELIQRLLDPTLSLEETARLLNVCPTTVRRYTNRGRLRHQRTGGDQRRFKLSDVLAFLENQSQPSPR